MWWRLSRGETDSKMVTLVTCTDANSEGIPLYVRTRHAGQSIQSHLRVFESSNQPYRSTVSLNDVDSDMAL